MFDNVRVCSVLKIDGKVFKQGSLLRFSSRCCGGGNLSINQSDTSLCVWAILNVVLVLQCDVLYSLCHSEHIYHAIALSLNDIPPNEFIQ